MGHSGLHTVYTLHHAKNKKNPKNWPLIYQEKYIIWLSLAIKISFYRLFCTWFKTLRLLKFAPQKAEILIGAKTKDSCMILIPFCLYFYVQLCWTKTHLFYNILNWPFFFFCSISTSVEKTMKAWINEAKMWFFFFLLPWISRFQVWRFCHARTLCSNSACRLCQ